MVPLCHVGLDVTNPCTRNRRNGNTDSTCTLAATRDDRPRGLKRWEAPGVTNRRLSFDWYG